eukprot:scaffold368_cov258-Pinguiococcus_pyrenoidosus.AAC.63
MGALTHRMVVQRRFVEIKRLFPGSLVREFGHVFPFSRGEVSEASRALKAVDSIRIVHLHERAVKESDLLLRQPRKLSVDAVAPVYLRVVATPGR